MTTLAPPVPIPAPHEASPAPPVATLPLMWQSMHLWGEDGEEEYEEEEGEQ